MRHGYTLKRNFGHGRGGFANLLGTLNLLAFALHAVLDSVSDLWRQARDPAGTRRAFFEQLLVLTQWFCFPCWTALFETMLGRARCRPCPWQRPPHPQDGSHLQTRARPACALPGAGPRSEGYSPSIAALLPRSVAPSTLASTSAIAAKADPICHIENRRQAAILQSGRGRVRSDSS